jgi:hypothetical protein
VWGIDWNPISWITSALHGVKGSIRTVYRWVAKHIAQAVDIVERDLEHFEHRARGWIVNAWKEIKRLDKLVDGIINDVGGDLHHELDTIRHEAAELVDDAVDDVETDITDLEYLARSLFKTGEHYAGAAVESLWQDVVRPVIRRIERALNVVEHDVDTGFDDLKRDVIPALEHDVAEALHYATEASGWIAAGGEDALQLINECWSWLEVLAQYPIDLLETTPAQVVAALPGAITTSALGPNTTLWQQIIDELETELPSD